MCKKNFSKSILLFISSLMMALPGLTAIAQDYPSKPVRIIVPLAPGGGMDTMGRLVAQRFGDSMKNTFIVENRPGGGNTLGSSVAIKAPGDGYTLLMIGAAHSVNPSLIKNLPYDSVRDFTFISQLASSPNVLVVHPSVPIKSTQDLVRIAKSQPGSLSYASAGNGSSVHLAGELFKYVGKLHILHVPYKGMAPALTDVIGGQVPLTFSSMLPAMPHVRSGRLRAIATTGLDRTKATPDIPAIAETKGFEGYEAVTWYGLSGPANIPSKIVNQLYEESRRAFLSEELKGKLEADGIIPIASSSNLFREFVITEIKKWNEVVKSAGITAG
jgi:tripartite-type tricarboxylate transporter receptor subunit TctC